MKVRISFLAQILIVMCVCASFVQEEKLSVEDILRWFPLDLYESVFHENRAAGEKTPGYSFHKQLGESVGGHDLRNVPLPEKFANAWSSVTLARKIKLQISQHKKNQTRRSQFLFHTARLEIGDTVYAAQSSGHWLAVYRFSNLDSLISTAEKAGEISPTDISVLNRKLYSSSGKVRRKNVSLYVYPAESQELLVCSDLNIIRKMVATGNGEYENFLGSKDFEPAADMLPDIGQNWYWNPISIHYQLILDKAEKDGIASHVIDRKRAEIECGMQWELLSYEFGENLTTIGMLYWGDEDRAKEHVKQNRMRFDPDRIGVRPSVAMLWKAKEIQRSGQLSRVTTVYTQELMDARIKANEEYEAEMKRKKSESEAKKDEQDR